MLCDRPTQSQRSAFFVPVPGEDHTLGLKMATDLLRAEGWTIDLAFDLSHDEILEKIGAEHLGLLGLTAAGEHATERLVKLVLALRIVAPQMMIFVGGNIADTNREILELAGVDGYARDFDEAHTILDGLWDRQEATPN